MPLPRPSLWAAPWGHPRTDSTRGLSAPWARTRREDGVGFARGLCCWWSWGAATLCRRPRARLGFRDWLVWPRPPQRSWPCGGSVLVIALVTRLAGRPCVSPGGRAPDTKRLVSSLRKRLSPAAEACRTRTFLVLWLSSLMSSAIAWHSGDAVSFLCHLLSPARPGGGQLPTVPRAQGRNVSCSCAGRGLFTSWRVSRQSPRVHTGLSCCH